MTQRIQKLKVVGGTLDLNQEYKKFVKLAKQN